MGQETTSASFYEEYLHLAEERMKALEEGNVFTVGPALPKKGSSADLDPMTQLDVGNPKHRHLIREVIGQEETLDIAHVLWFAMFLNIKTVRLTNGKVLKLQLLTPNKKPLKNFRTTKYLFIEQNPEKNSPYGRMARDGHKIMWILEGNSWRGRIQDGVFYSR